jgi:hypothetical protein
LGAFFFLAFFFLGFGAGTTLKLPLTLVNFLAFLSAVFSSLLLTVAPVAAMAFLMAGSEEPPRSLSVTMAAVASSDVVGPVFFLVGGMVILVEEKGCCCVFALAEFSDNPSGRCSFFWMRRHTIFSRPSL